jgi:hypothetical protein
MKQLFLCDEIPKTDCKWRPVRTGDTFSLSAWSGQMSFRTNVVRAIVAGQVTVLPNVVREKVARANVVREKIARANVCPGKCRAGKSRAGICRAGKCLSWQMSCGKMSCGKKSSGQMSFRTNVVRAIVAGQVTVLPNVVRGKSHAGICRAGIFWRFLCKLGQ